MQQAVERLFGLFSAYVAAATARERRQIHAQILDLFSELGVVSDSSIVRSAVEMFDSIKREATVPRVREATLANNARNLVDARVRAFERTAETKLSTGARNLLRIPVVEVAEFASQFNPEQTINSLDRVFTTLIDEPLAATEGTARVRTSIAVIRAFSKNFCRIPPFCSGGEQK